MNNIEPLTDAEMGVAPPAAPVEALTDEQMGVAPMAAEEIQPMTDDEMTNLEMKVSMSGRPSDQIAQNLQGTDAVNGMQAVGSAVTAAGEFYGKENGWLENAFYTMSLPEQAVARQAVNVLENLNMMSTDDAREILAADQVHGSDIVNFYWKNPTGISGVDKTLKFVTGLAVDILIDPLTYTGIGALTKLGKAATVGGKTMKLGNMAKEGRAYYKTLEAVEKIITSDGKLVHATKSAEEVLQHNSMMMAQARDSKMGFDELQQQLLASPEAFKEVRDAVKVGTTQKSWAKEWHEGSRGFTFGARIPFTDAAFEVDMPGIFNKMGALPIGALDATFNLGKSALRSTPVGNAGFELLADLSSRTGKFLFDVGQNVRLGSKTIMKEELAEFNKMSKAMLASKEKELGAEHFPQFWDDIVNELDNGLRDKDEVLALAEGRNMKPDHPTVTRLFSATQDDADRMVRLSRHPEAQAFIDDSRELMKTMADGYKSRGLPFEELNPFGEGWARQYMKRVVNQEYFDKMAESKEAGSFLATVMGHDKSMLGKVDESAKGRGARGTLQELNKASMEDPRFGVKMFVDDPAELISRRYEEMNKVIQDHDMMQTALPYAILGGDQRPQGYKLFDIDDYKKLSIERSKNTGLDGELAVGWDAFIPKGYKTGEKIWLPEDIAQRMDFNINGWGVDKPMAKILHAADGFTNVWRNSALFGTSYIGMNIFSNALTYLSHNDRGGIGALAKATAIAMPDTMLGRLAGAETKGISSQSRLMIKATDDTGAELMLSPEGVIRWMQEDNILGSTYTQGNEFRHIAEHVASNRKARQDLGQTLKTAADNVYLWKFSRGTAQLADDIPKMATYISYLEKGYTRGAAAEAAEKLFYNFNNMSKLQSGVAKAIPFSSFPMKTAEMVADTLRGGHLEGLTIPGKVQAALDGAFVQDHEARDALDQNLPGHHNVLHPIHGELMPGMRELQMDVPWTYSTMQTLFNPEDSTHPLFNILTLMGAAKTKTEDLLGLQSEQDAEGMVEQGKAVKRVMTESLDLFIPSYLREALTLADINGVDLGPMKGYFRDRYVSTMPTNKQVERNLSDRKTSDESAIMHKFGNAAEFGDAMDKHMGEDWLYNMIFPNRKEQSEDFGDMQDAGARGEYIRRKMRQLTGGVASITKLDSNFFMNNYAIKRQIDMKTRALKAEIVEAGVQMDTEKLSNEDFLALQVEKYPAAKEILALHYKKETLHDYYDFFLGLEKKIPDLDLPSMMFGMEPMDLESPDRPEKEVYQRLFKRETIKNIPDDDAAEVIDEIVDDEIPQ